MICFISYHYLKEITKRSSVLRDDHSNDIFKGGRSSSLTRHYQYVIIWSRSSRSRLHPGTISCPLPPCLVCFYDFVTALLPVSHIIKMICAQWTTLFRSTHVNNARHTKKVLKKTKITIDWSYWHLQLCEMRVGELLTYRSRSLMFMLTVLVSIQRDWQVCWLCSLYNNIFSQCDMKLVR